MARRPSYSFLLRAGLTGEELTSEATRPTPEAAEGETPAEPDGRQPAAGSGLLARLRRWAAALRSRA